MPRYPVPAGSPGISGRLLCGKLRQRKSQDHYQYVLLLSAKSRIHDVVAGLDAGANDYLIKPFDSSELLATVSVGVAMAPNATGCDLHRMIRAADISLDEAKKRGRNRIALSFLRPPAEVV